VSASTDGRTRRRAGPRSPFQNPARRRPPTTRASLARMEVCARRRRLS
jgi:hypothetical protein